MGEIKQYIDELRELVGALKENPFPTKEDSIKIECFESVIFDIQNIVDKSKDYKAIANKL